MLASSGQGYRVLRARNGEEALNILRERRPDVILLDLVMPKLDGFQLLEAKSQDPALSNIPVIVLSARDPAGQPIVSNALAITQKGGLSMHHLLAYIKMTGQVLSIAAPSADPMPSIMSSG
jgi:CheY-like chemotaxis protein